MSGMDVSDIFFSDKNMDFLYNVIRKDIEKRIDYDISRHNTNKRNFNKMVKIITH